MKLRCGLCSRRLSCGCLAGVYETYGGPVVTIIDDPSPTCPNADHQFGEMVPTAQESSGSSSLRTSHPAHLS